MKYRNKNIDITYAKTLKNLLKKYYIQKFSNKFSNIRREKKGKERDKDKEVREMKRWLAPPLST